MKKLLVLAVVAAALALFLFDAGVGHCSADPGQMGEQSGDRITLSSSVSGLNCASCHIDIYRKEINEKHAHSQLDVATELAGSHAGETPSQVIKAENCLACHGPTAVLVNGGMKESQALGYFFTTTGGVITSNTSTANESQWPSVGCVACHNVPTGHPGSPAKLGAFNSSNRRYVKVKGANDLCGQCHGNLRFRDTDHLIYNAWTMTKHSQTQKDVATELAGSHPGEIPDDVANSENCIFCHGPTSVRANGGMSESQALGYFFTTRNGKFTKNTRSAKASEWPAVGCSSCHDPHSPGQPAYYNSTTKKYEPVDEASQLCGQCHGNLHFTETDHLSYNIIQGTGGVNVLDQQTMPGVTCIDCHLFTNGQDGSNSTKYKGHTFRVLVKEADGTQSAACTNCHSTMDAAAASQKIGQWQDEFQQTNTQAQDWVGQADNALNGVNDPALQSKLDEAKKNLAYAESDESKGFHNHNYLMALLNDAIARAKEILK
jgi:formate-dependent nitrite reductase cytochrome c552 subunit